VTEGRISRYAAAIGYSAPEYAVTVHGLGNLSTFAASYYHRVSADVEAGAKAIYDPKVAGAVAMEVGAKAYLDSAAFVKAKINNSGVVALGPCQSVYFIASPDGCVQATRRRSAPASRRRLVSRSTPRSSTTLPPPARRTRSAPASCLRLRGRSVLSRRPVSRTSLWWIMRLPSFRRRSCTCYVRCSEQGEIDCPHPAVALHRRSFAIRRESSR
jgi:hypothetical protein